MNLTRLQDTRLNISELVVLHIKKKSEIKAKRPFTTVSKHETLRNKSEEKIYALETIKHHEEKLKKI